MLKLVKVSQTTALKRQMKTSHLGHFVSPTGIAVEFPQDATELDSFKLLFGDDIVDYIVIDFFISVYRYLDMYTVPP